MPEVTADATADAARRRYRRVGHKGADLIAPGNTLASFDAALEAGVDMIEFDVLPEHPPPKGAPDSAGSGPLRLVHDFKHLRETPGAPTLEAGLKHFAQEAFAGVELDVDLKLPGYEREVVGALRAHGLLDRCLISSQYIESIDLIRSELAPEVRLGWSVPKFKRDYSKHPILRYPFLPYALDYRRRLPGRAAAGLRARRFDALMCHNRLITPRLVRTIHEAGGELFAWTVDEPAEIARLEEPRRRRHHLQRPTPLHVALPQKGSGTFWGIGVEVTSPGGRRLRRPDGETFVTKSHTARSAGMSQTIAMALPANPLRVELDFEALYRSSRDDVYAYVAGLLRDRSAAEDVTALSFERALRRRRQFNAKRGSERQWLFGIARNAALDELRRRGRSAELAHDVEDSASPTLEDRADLALRRDSVRAALTRLHARDRELIALKFFAGLSNSEIAGVLDVSESNAGTLVHRALTKLRKEVGNA